MGILAILDRFRQIKPKLLIAQDQYIHAGKPVDRSAVVAQIAAAQPDPSNLGHRTATPDKGTHQMAQFKPRQRADKQHPGAL